MNSSDLINATLAASVMIPTTSARLFIADHN